MWRLRAPAMACIGPIWMKISASKGCSWGKNPWRVAHLLPDGLTNDAYSNNLNHAATLPGAAQPIGALTDAYERARYHPSATSPADASAPESSLLHVGPSSAGMRSCRMRFSVAVAANAPEQTIEAVECGRNASGMWRGLVSLSGGQEADERRWHEAWVGSA